jgi:O-antigen ligase
MNQSVATEQISTMGRSWLTGQAIEMIHNHPLTGVGLGSFIIELARTSVKGAPVEPVHNVFLLLFAELGVVGLIFILGLSLVLVLKVIASKSPHSILASAVLVGLGTISLFDHYLWTLAPGRIMVGVTVGLWAGQIAKDA